jgi:hypothetical protein
MTPVFSLPSFPDKPFSSGGELTVPRRRVYIPPSLSQIGAAVNAMANRRRVDDPILIDPTIQQGLISFLWIAGKILAKNLTEAEQATEPVDTHEK